MASILTDLPKMIVEKLMNLTIAEARYICCFTCIVEDFEKEKGKLTAKRTSVGEYVEAAKGRAEGIRPDVTDWEERADKLINEDANTKMTCFFGRCPNCKGRYLRGKELEDMMKEITSLKQNNFERDGVGLAPRAPGVEYHSSRDYISFESRESKYKELLDALKDDNNYITGLQGMGGTGKTTLAKEVGKKLKELKFDHVIDTTVSYTPDIKKIQDDIAGPLGLKWKDCSESERPKLLWSRLRNGEKILIILDDVWEKGPIDFEEIGIPFSGDHEGCRVLVTTRNVSVCVSMGCERERIIQLDLLPDEDAWALFEKHAGISDRFPKRLLDKGKEIVKECQGLPVAIAAIASTLKGQRSTEKWDVTLTSLKKSMPMHGVDKNMTRFYQCLSYSYEKMDKKTKELFLLCSVFQEDEQIPTEILTRFGVGVGLFGEVDNYDEARKEVVVAKDELIDSCLLLKAEEGRVKMHDLVREVAQWIANKKIQVVKLSNKNHKSLVEREKNIRYLSCEGKDTDVFSCRFDGSRPKLEILIVCIDVNDDSVEVPDSFFENMTGLQVLHLSNKRWPGPALSLRQSIESLTNIRSLILKGFKLDDISILGTLRSLETLDLLNCLITELPLTLTKLEKLRLLDLDDSEITSNPFEVIGRCSSLEEFYFGCNVDYLFDSTEAIHQNITLPTLQRYRLIRRGYHYINDSISKCVCLPNIDALFSETTFKDLVKRAEILRLEGIEVEWGNLIPEIVPINEGMNDLVELCLSDCSKNTVPH